MEHRLKKDTRSLEAEVQRLLRKSGTARRIGQRTQADSLEARASALIDRVNGAPKPERPRRRQESYC